MGKLKIEMMMITLQGFLSAFNSNISNYVVRGILQKCG
jgi:hypothetical protein